jgi:hypothetical protein
VYPSGAVVPLRTTAKDAAGTPINVGTITLVVTKPDNTAAAGTTPANPPATTGQYAYDYVAPDQGRYAWRWTSSAPTLTPHVGVFYVRSGAPRWIASAEDVQALLNGQGDLDEIGDLLQMATAWVESRIGPVANETVVEKHDGGYALALRRPPVVSVTSVVPIRTGGVAQVIADLDVDGPSGIVERKDGEEALLATAEIAAHLWRRDHGMGTDTFGSGDELPTGFGFAVPRAAAEMIKHLRNSWGV